MANSDLLSVKVPPVDGVVVAPPVEDGVPFTRTMQVAVAVPDVAVTVQFPPPTAVTTPFSTLATASSLLVQVIVPVAPAGVTSGWRFQVSPTLDIVKSSRLSLIPVTSDGTVTGVVSEGSGAPLSVGGTLSVGSGETLSVLGGKD